MIQGFTYPASRGAAKARGALFVLSALGVGGSERKVARVVTALTDRGAEASICVLGPPYTLAPAFPAHCRLRKLDRRGRISPKTLMRLRGELLECRPHTIIAVDLFALLYASIALRLARLDDVQRVVLINTTDFVRRRDRLFMHGYASLLRHSDLLVFGSFRQREAWLRRYQLQGVASRVLHNGVDAAHFSRDAQTPAEAARRQAGIPAGRIVIGTVGRIAPEKNQAALVHAIARLRADGVDAHLLIVGDGPLRQQILEEAAALDVRGCVTLAGEVQDIRPLLAAMSLFALPSTSVETFSNAALEAMAMSLPVVLSDIGGAREMVTDGSEGLIVPVADQKALCAALRTLCTNPQRLHSMGRAARARIEREFAFDRMVAAYHAIIAGQPEDNRGDMRP